MSRYRKIDIRMHGDAVIASLSRPQPNARSLWDHLLYGPSTGIVPGLYRAGEAQLAEELGWDIKGFRDSFQELASARQRLGREGTLVQADWESKLVWVPNAIKYNEPSSPNIVKHWAAAFDELPECALKAEAYIVLGNYCDARGEAFSKAFQAVPKPSAISFEKASWIESGIESPRQCRIQEQEQEQEEIHTSAEPQAGKPAKSDPVFDHWVTVMGKGAGTLLTADRKKKLKARRQEGFSDERLCLAIDGCKRSEFHMGKNDRGELYNDLATILKDGSTVEKHIERATGRPSSAPGLFGRPGFESERERTERILREERPDLFSKDGTHG